MARELAVSPSVEPAEAGARDELLDYKSLAATVSDRIATEIISGVLPAGHRLTETEVADRLGVSRSPVREALRRLSAEGLVEIKPRRGAQVTALDPKDASALYETRMLLEPHCSRLAVNEMSEGDVRTLSGIFQLMEEAVKESDDEAFLDLNIKYHRALVTPCPNEVLLDLVELTWSRSDRYWCFLRLIPVGHMAASFAFHKRIHKAVKAADAELVEQSVRELLAFALKQILGNFPSIDERERDSRAGSAGDQPKN